MSATLLALYRRPVGADETTFAEFRRRYAAEHLPLIRAVPGLSSLHVGAVTEGWGSDLALVCRMVFADRLALEAALTSEPMRAARRNLREIAAGMPEMVIVEPDPTLESGTGGQPE